MSVEALLARITRDAEQRAAVLRREAEAEIAALTEARERAMAADRSRELAARSAERGRRLAAERAQAARQAAARVLRAQHALLDRVLARAEVLGESAVTQALQALPEQLRALARHTGNAATTLRCRPELLVTLQRLAAPQHELEVRADAAVPTGFIAATQDGRCTIDCTLAALLRAARPRLQAPLLVAAGCTNGQHTAVSQA